MVTTSGHFPEALLQKKKNNEHRGQPSQAEGRLLKGQTARHQQPASCPPALAPAQLYG